MTSKLAYIAVGVTGVVAILHELGLRQLIEDEVAGSLLSAGGDPRTLFSAVVVILLRVTTFALVATLPALAVSKGLSAATTRGVRSGSVSRSR